MSLVEMVEGGVAVAGVGAVMGAMAAVAATVLAVVVVVSGIVCAALAEVLSEEAIAVAPPVLGHQSVRC